MTASMPPPPPIQNNTNQPERPNLAGKTWYYGAITRNQCDTVLNQHGHDGDFLIRDSETNVSKSSHHFFVCFFVSCICTFFIFYLKHHNRWEIIR